MRRLVSPITALLAAASVSVDASALEVHLTNGKRIAGSVRLTPKTVTVRAGATVYNIPRGAVRAVTLSAAERFEFEKRRRALGVSADDHAALAKWLASKHQHAEAEEYYDAAIALDENHEEARRALGYERTDGKWTRTDEDHWRIRSTWLGFDGAEASFRLAKLYRERGDEKRVEPMLRRALIASPRHLGALRMMRPITDKYQSKNKFRLPVEGLWGIIHDYNDHHKKAAFMAYALDFMKVDERFRSTRVRPATKVEDYYTWGATIHAAADGVVYSLNDGFRDSPVGRWTDFHSANTVCIRHAHGEYTVYGHLKNGSITVKKGQKVKAGQVIARGGNSGSSGWPHMHFAMYDRDGIGLPLTFIEYSEVTRTGEKPGTPGHLGENRFYRNTFRKKQ